ncbi:MAG: HD domain-containing protein [Lachnospiraceae bacterium]|nr:HD domain-containing protein [Lachnospiraceae bacterium]
MRYIKDVREGDQVIGIYLCKKKNALKDKNGRTYYALTLQDKTGTVEGKIWDLTNAIGHFEAFDYIDIHANVTSFQGALQFTVTRARKAQSMEYDPADYLPVSRYSLDRMMQDLESKIGNIEEPFLHELLVNIFINDKELRESFKNHSAAASVHHAFVGGLLEHSLSVANLCDFFAKRYNMLNRDLLVTAALLHDIGKTRELSDFPHNDYTDEGQFLGHIVIGVEMVGRYIDKIPDFPVLLAQELKHIILAHHGKPEFGSPKTPSLAEAYALNMADDLDAKMELFRTSLGELTADESWTGFNKFLNNTRIRKTEV